MLYRTAAIGIAAFWVVMMILLVRLETHPESTDILNVPVSYVMRLIFRHGQPSFLTARDGGKEIGTIYLRPSTTGTDSRVLNYSGAIEPELPNGSTARVNFTGIVHLNAALEVRDFHTDISLRDPPSHLTLEENSTRNTLSYQLRAGGGLAAAQTLPLTGQGLASALSQNPQLRPLAAFAPSSFTPPSVTAREASIPMHGEELQVYQVTMAEGSTPLLDIYVTQLGQIISAKTNSGLTLTTEGMP